MIAPTPSLHLVRSAASSIFNPTFFTFFHVIFGCPRFRYPFNSIIIAFFSILLSSLLITCPYHLTPFAFAILSNVFFKPYISVSSFVFFLSTNFAPQIDLTMLFQFSKMPFHFPSNTMFHFHTALPILHNFDKPSLSFSKKTFDVTTPRIL